MLTFSTNIKNILAANSGQIFYNLWIKNGDGSLFRASTTHHSTMTMSNNIVYVADDFIVSVDPPQLSTTVDREQYKIILADNTFDSAAQADNVYVGKLVEARLGFIDPATGLPLLNIVDSLVVYKGRIDGASSKITTDEIGESLFNISCASPMLSLDMRKGLYLSRDVIRGNDPNDGCCDQIYEGSGTLILKWGRS